MVDTAKAPGQSQSTTQDTPSLDSARISKEPHGVQVAGLLDELKGRKGKQNVEALGGLLGLLKPKEEKEFSGFDAKTQTDFVKKIQALDAPIKTALDKETDPQKKADLQKQYDAIYGENGSFAKIITARGPVKDGLLGPAGVAEIIDTYQKAMLLRGTGTYPDPNKPETEVTPKNLVKEATLKKVFSDIITIRGSLPAEKTTDTNNQRTIRDIIENPENAKVLQEAGKAYGIDPNAKLKPDVELGLLKIQQQMLGAMQNMTPAGSSRGPNKAMVA